MNSKTSLNNCLENGKVSYKRNGFQFLFSLKKKNDNENNSCREKESFGKIPFYVAVLAYIGFYILLFLGYLNQFLFTPKGATEQNRNGYPALYNKFQIFYFNYIFRRLKDGFEKPICSVPGVEIMLKDRITEDLGWTYQFTGTESKYLNLGSYNYLGFAQSDGICAENSIEAITKYGCASSSPRKELGTITLHTDLEKLTARFLGVEAAIVFGMGFATNVLNIGSIISSNCLVLSDEKNHASLILGLKLSGATIRIYKHNDMKSLENNLIDGLKNGNLDTKKPWGKVFIVTEGIFSMEGSIVKLPSLLYLKKKYKAYLYIDEAHSVGALGLHGRGIVDYFGCDPKQIDILMGTFTKSFGSAGGYIAGSNSLIDHIRAHSEAEYYAASMPSAVAQQIITSMKIIIGEDGTNDGIKRIRRLVRNTHYFRQRLKQMGCTIYGNDDSPVVPMLVYMFGKVIAIIRAYSDYNIAVVGVGFPATPLMESRIRFCISAGHTMKQLKLVLEVTEKIADELGLRYSRRLPLYENIKYESEDDDV